MDQDNEAVDPEALAEAERMLDDTNIVENVAFIGEGFRSLAHTYSIVYKISFEQALNLITTNEKVLAVIIDQIRKKLLSDGQ